tara:strand:+ start:564 stop:1040 length:477 start_codon:yes stop_codon:yes gene_type:complete
MKKENWLKDNKLKTENKLITFYRGSENSDINHKNVNFFSKNKTFAEDYGEIKEYYLRSKKPFDSTDIEHIEKLLTSIGFIEDPYSGNIFEDAESFVESLSSDTWEGIENNLNTIQALGFDSVIVYEGGIQNYIVFSPEQIIKKEEYEKKIKNKKKFKL